ncbi:MAG: ATP-dependent helicase, partial [Gammaproteobacteria bacterium]|nr:ATP-dependent helicase [Gammaproteobacteria bacterium]
GIVLDVLLRKHSQIRSSLGISVPVPVDANQVVEAIFEGLLLKRKPSRARQLALPEFEDFALPQKETLYKDWDAAVEREKKSRTMFAQHTIKVKEVIQELAAVRDAVGQDTDVAHFIKQGLSAHGAAVSGNGTLHADLTGPELDLALVQAVGRTQFKAKFQIPVKNGEIYLNRTHPIVEGLASYVMESAFDEKPSAAARRCGVIQTANIKRRTTVVLMRFRYHIITQIRHKEKRLLAENSKFAGFAGAPANASWLSDEEVEKIILLRPDMNVSRDRAVHFLARLMEDFDALQPHLSSVAQSEGKRLLTAHRRVRSASRLKHVRYRIEPHLPPDVLGTYIYLPTKQKNVQPK